VVVAGGGSAGVAAAIGAARTGARTLLIERGPCLGGAATLRQIATFCGLFTRDDSRQVVFGIADEILNALRRRDALSDPTLFTAVSVVFDPEILKTVLDELCRQAGVVVSLHTNVVAAHAQKTVDRVVLADHAGLREVTASAFVDATGEADLATFAGAAVRYGNDGIVQTATLAVRFGGIPRDVEINRRTVAAAVRLARANGAEMLAQESGLVARLPGSGDVLAYLVDESYDARDVLDLSRAEARARRAALSYLDVIRTIPGADEAYLVSTGPELGTRESRHILAPRRLEEGEVLDPVVMPDAIAVGAWPVEYHPGVGQPAEWAFIGGKGSYGIPLDALRSVTYDNLFTAGRSMDGDRRAGSSTRVMGTALATGQAAGVAAAIRAQGRIPESDEVRSELDAQGAILPPEHVAPVTL